MSKILGVDIGTRAIKVCQVDLEGVAMRIEGVAHEIVPPGLIGAAGVVNQRRVVDVIRRATHALGVSTGHVVLSIPANRDVVVRSIRVPLMTILELEEQIRWEAEMYVPFALEEAYVMHSMQEERAAKGEMDVLLVAPKRSIVASYLDAARHAGLHPRSCVVDVIALLEWFNRTRSSRQDCIALVDVGATWTRVIVVERGNLRATRTIEMGGETINRTLCERLGVSDEEAESMKREGTTRPVRGSAYRARGVHQGELVRETIRTVADSIAQQVARVTDYAETSGASSAVEEIYLTGGSARLPELAQSVERIARHHVEVWSEDDENSRIWSDGTWPNELSIEMRVACGLATDPQPNHEVERRGMIDRLVSLVRR